MCDDSHQEWTSVETLGLSLKHPAHWDSYIGEQLILWPSHCHSDLIPRIEIQVQTQTRAMPLAEINKQIIAQIKASLHPIEDFRISEQRLAGLTAKKIMLRAQVQGIPTQHFFAWIIDRQKEYIIGFYAKRDEFERYGTTVNKILQSITVLNPKPVLWDLVLKVHNDPRGFKFFYPETWEIEEPDLNRGVLLHLVGNSVTNRDKDIIPVHLTVSVLENILKAFSFEQYIKLYKFQLEKMLVSDIILYEKRISGNPSFIVSFKTQEKQIIQFIALHDQLGLLDFKFYFSFPKDLILRKTIYRIIDTTIFTDPNSLNTISPSIDSSSLIYEHLLDRFGIAYDESNWRLLPQPNSGVVFLRKSREETSRLLILRESTQNYSLNGKSHIPVELENALIKELTHKVHQQNGKFTHKNFTDTVLANHPSRVLHFIAQYKDRRVCTIIQFMVDSSPGKKYEDPRLAEMIGSPKNGDYAYIINFGCLCEHYNMDWPAARKMLEEFYLV